jgi:mannose-1-phosphate guanylyltransferase / phosphomannomutase
MKSCVFLDRDGVICEDKHFLSIKEDLELIPGSAQAISLLNKNNFLSVLVTNQPVVARGICSYQDVVGINNYLLDLLREEGAYLDGVYFCPHHPTIGDNPFYTRECDCRKPKSGMLFEAALDMGLKDFSDCSMVGDRISDVIAGKNAGCRTILVSTGYGGVEAYNDAVPDYMARDLFDAVNSIILGK